MVVELVAKLGPEAVDHLEGMFSGVEHSGVELMDNLYAKMLFDVFGQLAAQERKASRSILAAIVLAKDPLRKSDIVELLSSKDSSVDETRRSVESAVDQLSCIISVDDDDLLRIPHKSFTDFLLDYDRSLAAVMPSAGDEDHRSYVVNQEEDSANLAIACLRIMISTLKFNACGIPTSHCLNDEVPQLESLLSENISPALVYACRFWAEHLKGASCDDVQLRAAGAATPQDATTREGLILVRDPQSREEHSFGGKVVTGCRRISSGALLVLGGVLF